MQVRIQCGYEAEYVAAFLAGSVRGKVARGAPCAFQRLRLGGKALDGELARLVPRAVLTSARTDAVSPLRARAFPPAPLSLKAQIRPCTTFPSAFRQFRERWRPLLLTDVARDPVRERWGLILLTNATLSPFHERRGPDLSTDVAFRFDPRCETFPPNCRTSYLV